MNFKVRLVRESEIIYGKMLTFDFNLKFMLSLYIKMFDEIISY